MIVTFLFLFHLPLLIHDDFHLISLIFVPNVYPSWWTELVDARNAIDDWLYQASITFLSCLISNLFQNIVKGEDRYFLVIPTLISSLKYPLIVFKHILCRWMFFLANEILDAVLQVMNSDIFNFAKWNPSCLFLYLKISWRYFLVLVFW